jgi:rhodanese-related sulfurtransferase
MSHNPGFLKVVEDAKKQVEEVSVEQVQKWLETGHTFHFVDVREDSEWQEGYAARAEHIGKGVIERDIETKIPDKNAEIVLYCGGGFRSALAGEMLLKMGYKNILSMAGGIREWRAKKLPESKP